MFTLREYQQHALDALRQYFQTCVQLNSVGAPNAANVAFYQCTLDTFGVGMPYNPIPELAGLPYVCLRIPTGGGKTFVACHAVACATKDLLQADQSVVLWLVPSNAIREQTLDALKDRRHPYRLALEERLGAVTILDVNEALSVTRATLNTSTTIIVSTIQAFRVEDIEGRKVYESSGALMDHFSGYPQTALDDLETYDDTAVEQILGRVMRLPHVKRKQQEALNQAYAYAASANFAAAAESLIDGLVQNGFNRLEAKDMVVLPQQTQLDLKELPLFSQIPPAVPIAVLETPQLDGLPAETAAKVHVDSDSGAIAFTGPMDERDLVALKACYETDEGKTAVDRAFREARILYDTRSPAERGEVFSIPVLAYQQGELPLEPFEETHFKRMLQLSKQDATLTEQEFPTERPQARQARIDVQKDKLKVEFITDLHQQMRLLASDQGWEESDLIYWLDQTIAQRHDILPSESGAFLPQASKLQEGKIK